MSTSEILSPLDYCRKRRKKKNGPNGKRTRETLQADGSRGTGRYQFAFQVAQVKTSKMKHCRNAATGVPTAQSHRVLRDLPQSERNDKSMATAIYLTAFLTIEKRNSGQVCGYVFIQTVKRLRWQGKFHAI